MPPDERLDPELELDGHDEEERADDERADDESVGTFSTMLGDRRRLLTGALLFVALVVAIYVLFPKVVGLDDSLAKLDDATWYWIVIAVVF
ncbi:MAG: hypothetical protein ACM3UV_08830, partial [Nocardioidaceae bacterium]